MKAEFATTCSAGDVQAALAHLESIIVYPPGRGPAGVVDGVDGTAEPETSEEEEPAHTEVPSLPNGTH